MALGSLLRQGLGAGGRTHGAVAAAAALDAVAVDAGRTRCGEAALACLLPAVIVDVFEIEGVDVARDVAQNGQANVDQEISTTARDDVDADRRAEDGDEDQENGGAGTHFGCCCEVTRYVC